MSDDKKIAEIFETYILPSTIYPSPSTLDKKLHSMY